MIKEALEFLAEQATNASVPYIESAPAEPPHVYYKDGEKVHAEPNPRSHEASDITAVIEFAKEFTESRTWYTRNALVSVLNDDADRRERIRLQVNPSQQISTVIKWGNKSTPMSQAGLILLLRTMFKHSLAQAPKLIEILRVLKFNTGKSVDSSVQKGKTSVGKSIESEVTGAAEIPDDFILDVPLFDGIFPRLRGQIEIAIEMDAASETFTLYVVPGSVEGAYRDAEDIIGNTLREELGEKVYYGTP